jgi:steroid 5-alpha reductase family enzyme
LFGTLLMTDILEFAGLRQLAALLSGESLPLPPVPFKAGGPYALVRHPLYLFGLILLWASPVLTVNSLLLNLGATAYLVIGIYPEERKLLAVYGEDYRVYRQQVPPLLPWPRP